MSLPAQALLDALQTHRLLADDKLAGARQWLSAHPLAPGTDPGAYGTRFSLWLTEQALLTPFQLDFIVKGKAGKLRLDDYVLIDRVGVGRMAGIYKARKGGQTVAVKILPPSKAKDAAVFARFQREGRLAARLKHPNVVRTFDMGEADGLHYIAMEYLEGETLQDVLKRRGKLPAEEVTRLLRQALEGLEHLHEQDVVHRDLKPANLMLTSVPRSSAPAAGRATTVDSTVKLLDVGLGRTLFDDAPEGHVDLTEAGDLLGTVAYMAPEQARDAHQADVRSDLYSLGCVAYHALTGQPPFVDASTMRVLTMHAKQPPRPLREIDAAIPAGLAGVIEKLLAKDPSQRFATPKAARQALDGAAGPPPKAGAVPAAEHGPAQSGRAGWPLYAGGGAIAAALVVVLVVVFSRSGHTAAPQANPADSAKTAQATRVEEPNREPPRSTVDGLVKRLQDADAGKRVEAVQELAKLGDEARPAYAALLEAVKDQDAAVRDQASATIAGLKATSAELPMLRAALRDPSPALRGVAAGALGDLGQQAKGELVFLRVMTLDENVSVKEAAQKAVERVEADLLATLVQSLQDKAPQVRSKAAKELADMGEHAKEALPTLIETLSDRNSAVRVAVLEALQAIGPQAVLVLGESLRDKNLDVRLGAINALGRLGPDARAVLPDLVLGVLDTTARIKEETVQALTRIGDYAIPYVMEALEREKAPARQMMLIAALERLGPEAAPAVQLALKKAKPEVNQAAAVVLKKIEAQPPPAPRKELTGTAGLIQGQLRAWFAANDTNKDGFLDKQELAKAMRGARAPAFDVSPAGAGLKQFTPKEFDRYPDLAFLSRVDRDNDGKVSRDEFEHWAYDFAEYTKKDLDRRDEFLTMQLRLQERGLSEAMRQQTEVAIQNAWTARHLAWRSNIQLSQANWMQRYVLDRLPKRK
jgi:HEAT repeat protein